jgi:hypothetical protein
MYSRPNWDLLANTKSLDDLKKEGFWPNIFTTIFQAHLPNPDKAPLFIDLQAHKVGDQFVVDSKITERLRNNFLLETMIPKYSENLKSLRGFKFDCERNDGNQDHVYANQALLINWTNLEFLKKQKNTAAYGDMGSGPRTAAFTRKFYHSSPGISSLQALGAPPTTKLRAGSKRRVQQDGQKSNTHRPTQNRSRHRHSKSESFNRGLPWRNRRGFVAETGDVEKLTKLLGHAPRRYEDFAAETAALWK